MMTKSPASDTPEQTETGKATQEEFDHEVKRMQSLIAHVQLRTSQLKALEGASTEAVEKVQEVEALLERAEELLEEAELQE